ncbi:hypothetical protein HA48_12055 [Pantoea wallisii]|uniref:O-antigen translocase n=1 Tax=Pantoea wallisii TaxID=1076551 RepID=A0A1X1D8C4_9GAMM|nr:O-antigen translocase [Pantoea wallisii]ORM72925.1 hypothetical protein HA48_12055 [Pantoea wallisii]
MKKMLRVTISTAVLTFYRILSSFIIAKAVAVYTGPAGIAMLGQIQSFFISLNGIAISPVGNGIVRYTSENLGSDINKCSNWWRAAISCSLVFFMFLLPLTLFFKNEISGFLFQEESYDWLILLCCSLLPLSIINTAFISVINGQQQYRKYIAIGFISITFSTLFVLYLVYKFQLTGALIAAVINTSISGLVVLIISCKERWFRIKYWLGVTEWSYFKDIIKYILMAITSAIAPPLALIFVRKILVAHTGWGIAGQWQAVWKVSEVYLSIVTLALSTYYLPQLSKLKTAEEIRKEINNATKVILPTVIILALCVYFMRDVILRLLFTDDFTQARDLFAVQLVGDVIKITAWLYAFPMLAKGAMKWFVSSEILFSLSFVLLSFWLVYYFNVQGANWAYLINYCAYFLFVFLNLDRIIGLKNE